MKLFYNLCLKDDTAVLDSDILSGVRRSYFDSFGKIKDRITVNSNTDDRRDGNAISYDYSIEKEKPMRWEVRSQDGTVLQNTSPSDNRKYYICFYRDESLCKRILFSHLHTLLRVEYYDVPTGMQLLSLEPRKAHDSLCILYDSRAASQPIVLMPAAGIGDVSLRRRVERDFDDYTVRAATDDGMVLFVTDEQQNSLDAFVQRVKNESAEIVEESFVGEDTPLFDRIKAKDFNVKRNLATSLDITKAAAFSLRREDDAPAAEQAEAATDAAPYAAPQDEQSAAETLAAAAAAAISASLSAEQPAADAASSDASADLDAAAGSAPDAAERHDSDASAAPSRGIAPDKLIVADGAMYSYYGELDANGNRSGYGRTLTDDGRTAYEGSYRNDKRSGVGSYYYRDGSLCYTGEWVENVRHGVGVGVSSGDGSIHVGRWSLNKPVGSGVRLTADGNVKFVCYALSDGTTVLVNTMPDDRVLIAKYDEKGKKIGEKAVSLKDILN